jgi:hypothetical protein
MGWCFHKQAMASMENAEVLGKALKTCGIKGALYHTGDESGAGFDYSSWSFVLRQYFDKKLASKYNTKATTQGAHLQHDNSNKVFFTPLGYTTGLPVFVCVCVCVCFCMFICVCTCVHSFAFVSDRRLKYRPTPH